MHFITFYQPNELVMVRFLLIMYLLSLYTGEALTEETSIQLPENMIDGSARASLSVLGKRRSYLELIVASWACLI